MGRSSALLLAALVAIGASASARAADLLPPPPMMEPPPPPPDFGGWYLRGDVGAGITELSDFRSTLGNPLPFVQSAPSLDYATIGDQALIGAGVGYQFNNWFRFDVTGEYRTAANYSSRGSYTDWWSAPGAGPCGWTRCYDLYGGQVRSAVFLANAYFDLGTWYGITPFVGGGVGLASHWFDNFSDFGPQTGGYGYAPSSSQANFAWAVMAGLGYNVTPNLKLELGYRYLDMGNVKTGAISCQGGNVCAMEHHRFDLASHDIRLGFRYALGGIGPGPVLMPPPGPLVRKY